MPVQNLKTLKRAADRFLDAAAQGDDDRLPLNFGWFADFIRVHFASPRGLSAHRTQSTEFCSIEPVPRIAFFRNVRRRVMEELLDKDTIARFENGKTGRSFSPAAVIVSYEF
jgi:hypothetical protein